jgi:multiple sugar transport system ATP-binding protein
MARIAFQGIAKRFGDVSVIEQLDLEIHDHEFMVFVGPSGCGKSTALRMIAGLEEPSEGTLVIGDRVVNDVHPKDRDVAMVFQSYALYRSACASARCPRPRSTSSWTRLRASLG